MTALPAVIARACANMPEVSLEPSAELTVQGAPGGALFVLIAGSVKVVRDDSELSRIDEPGAIFGEVPLLLGTPVAASVIATSPSRFYVIEDGATFQRDNPDFTLYLCKMLALRVHLLSGYLADIKTQFADQDGHLGMLHEVLCSLCQHPNSDVTLGSDRLPDPPG